MAFAYIDAELEYFDHRYYFFSILNKNNNLTHNAVRCGVELPFSLLTATGNSMPSLSRWLEFHRNRIFSLGFSIVSLGGHTL